MYQNRPYVNTHYFLDANIPESYFISSGGLTANTYPDLLGEYFLSDTHYKGRWAEQSFFIRGPQT